VSAPQREWIVKGLIPAGAVVAIADLDDPSPDEILAAGCDVVLLLHDRGAIDDRPVLFEVRWRPGLMPGHKPPDPFCIRRNGDGFAPVREEAA
jgi:hypothetical protein